jgi:hypothetical protein
MIDTYSYLSHLGAKMTCSLLWNAYSRYVLIAPSGNVNAKPFLFFKG